MTVVRFRGAVLGVCVGAVLVAGCSGSGSKPAAQDSTSPPASSSPAASASSSLSPDQLAVVRAYSKFWGVLSPASRASSANAQLALLIPVTTDPELSQLISGFARLHKQGRALYGRNLPRPTSVDLSPGQAVIRDCQDSHAAGVERVSSGQRLTVGVHRHLVTATLLKRGPDWKVSRVEYAPAGTRC